MRAIPENKSKSLALVVSIHETPASSYVAASSVSSNHLRLSRYFRCLTMICIVALLRRIGVKRCFQRFVGKQTRSAQSVKLLSNQKRESWK